MNTIQRFAEERTAFPSIPFAPINLFAIRANAAQICALLTVQRHCVAGRGHFVYDPKIDTFMMEYKPTLADVQRNEIFKDIDTIWLLTRPNLNTKNGIKPS